MDRRLYGGLRCWEDRAVHDSLNPDHGVGTHRIATHGAIQIPPRRFRTMSVQCKDPLAVFHSAQPTLKHRHCVLVYKFVGAYRGVCATRSTPPTYQELYHKLSTQPQQHITHFPSTSSPKRLASDQSLETPPANHFLSRHDLHPARPTPNLAFSDPVPPRARDSRRIRAPPLKYEQSPLPSSPFLSLYFLLPIAFNIRFTKVKDSYRCN